MDKDVHHFYETLLDVLKLRTLREGTWQLLECTPAWEGSATSQGFIAYSWQPQEGRKIQEKPLLVAVNYASFQGQGYLRLPYPELRGKIILADLLDPMTRYERDGNALAEKGLYLDIPAWKAHVFEMQVQFE